MNLFSLFWEHWFGEGSRDKRKAAPRRKLRQMPLGYEWLEDRRLLTSISEVQAFAAEQFQANVSSFAVTVPNAIKAGHTVFVEVAIDNPGNVTISDSAGNTYTKDADVSNGSGIHTSIFRASGVTPLSAGGSITVTVPGGTVAKAVAVQEFAGLSSSPTDQTATNHGNSTSPTSNALGTITTQASELLLGAIGVTYAGTGSFTPGSGYTALPAAGTTDGTGPNETIRPEYQIVSSTGLYAATGTLGAAAAWDAILYTYKGDLATKYGLSGVPASATAGTAFNLTVTAQQSNGSTDTGYTGTVHFTSSDGIAGLPSDYAFTTADAGVHTFSVTLKTAGSSTLTVTDADDNTVTATSSSIAVSAAAASKFAISSPGTATAGTAFNNLTVTAKDAYGNIASSYLGTIHFTSSDGQAVLPGNYTFTAANSGTQTFSVTLKTSGSQTVSATDTVTSSITGTSAAVTTAPAAAASLAVSAPGTATAGGAFNVALTAKDAFGNTATGYTGTVHFTSSDAQAVLPGDYTFTAGDAGVKTISVTLKTAANQTVAASDTVSGSIAGTSGSVSVAAAAAATLSIAAPPSATAGSAFNITVTAKDAYGNTAAGYTGTVQFTSTDGAAGLPSNYTFVAGDAGTHTLSMTYKTAASETVTATDTLTGSITGTSAATSVVAAAATHFSFSSPGTATAGTAFNMTLTAFDQYGNTATGYLGTVHFTSTDGAAALPSDYTFVAADAGAHLFSVTLKTAGNATIAAEDTATNTIAGTSGTIATVAGAAARFSLATPANATAGTAFNVTVTALDAYGNAATAYAGTVQFTSSDGAAALPANSTLTSGSGTFSVTLKTSGSQTITATDTLNASIASTSGAIATAAASATRFAVSAAPSATAGLALNITVTAEDAYGNTDTRYAGTAHFTSSDTQAVLPADSTLTSGTATFVVTLKTAGSQTVSAVDTLNGSIAGSSSAIATQAASATHFAVSAPASAYAGAAFSVTVAALDAYGNTDTHYAGTVHFTSTDAAAALPGDYTFVSANSGTHTFSVDLKTAGNQTVTVADTASGSITGASGTISTAAASSTHMVIAAPANATAGSTFSVTVTAKDQFNNISTSYSGTLHFTSSDAAAALPADAMLTNGTGTFSVTLKTAGPQIITAVDTGDHSINGTSGSVATTAAAATRFVLGSPAAATAGGGINVTLTAEDPYGNTDTNYVGTMHFTSSDADAVLPGDYTFGGADAGTASFSVTFTTAGEQTVTAADTVNPSIAGTSGGVMTSAASATHLAIIAPANATAGSAINVTVTALDAYGNTDTAYDGTVRFTSSDGRAALPANYTFAAGDLGTKTFSVMFRTAGNRTIAATDTLSASINGASPAVAVGAATASTFAVSAPAAATAGTTIDVTVIAYDPYGNIATGYGGNVAFSSTDAAAALPGSSTLNAGMGTFAVTLKTAGSRTVSARDTTTASISGTSGSIGISPAVATHLAVSAAAGATAGTAFTFTVTALDAYNNVATGYTGTLHFSSSDPLAALPGDDTFTASDAGSASFSVALKTAGNQTIAAADTVAAAITGTSGTIAVQAAAATRLTVIAPTTAVSGTAFTLQVIAVDVYGNTDTHYAGIVQFSSTDAGAALPADSPLSGGTGSFSVVLNLSGSQTVTAADVNNAALSGTTGVINVAANIAALNGTSPVAYEGSSISNVMLATFTYNNNSLAATSFTSTVDWGDGTQSTGLVIDSGNGYRVVGSHLYGELGSYTIAVSVATGAASGQTWCTASVYAPLLPDGTRGDDAQRYISAVYFSLLGRAVDANALAYWTSALAQGVSYASFVQAVEASTEYRACEVNAIYRRYLSRNAEPAGLLYWTQFLAGGGTREQVIAAVLSSPEYYRNHGGGSADTFLQSVYEDVFARAIDDTAFAVLKQAMSLGMGQNQIANIVLTAPEYYSRLIRDDYQQFLGRDAEPAAVAQLSQFLSDGGRDEQVIEAMIGGPAGSEYYQRVTA